VGIDHVICLSQAAKIPHEALCDSIELFTKEVLPEFKERDQKCVAQQAARKARINEIAMKRRKPLEQPSGRTVIRAAGHH
jgi:hypothetical protein